MTLLIVSDLHTEFASSSPSGANAEVVVLAGDIGVGMGVVEWAARQFSTTLVVYVALLWAYDLLESVQDLADRAFDEEGLALSPSRDRVRAGGGGELDDDL